MTDNRIPAKWSTQQDFSPHLGRVVAEITAETGFVAEGEVQRRMIYDPDKTWRVRFSGTYQGKPALLRVENLKLERDEEAIREAFRHQARGSRVRPPRTYFSKPFDESKGYAFSIDEQVNGNILFDPAGEAITAVQKFIPFYRELRRAVTEPFWPNATGDVHSYSAQQADAWLKLAQEKNPAHTKTVLPMVRRLREAMLASLPEQPLRFMHAHLSGWDVRVDEEGDYVVFANHFWSWRQSGYDVAFPLWGQWMALPVDHRSAHDVQAVTETWLDAVRRELDGLVSFAELRPLLFNRLYGSLLLDIPAKKSHEAETPASVQALEDACLAESERLLA